MGWNSEGMATGVSSAGDEGALSVAESLRPGHMLAAGGTAGARQRRMRRYKIKLGYIRL